MVHSAEVLLAAADPQRHEVFVLGLQQKCIAYWIYTQYFFIRATVKSDTSWPQKFSEKRLVLAPIL